MSIIKPFDQWAEELAEHIRKKNPPAPLKGPEPLVVSPKKPPIMLQLSPWRDQYVTDGKKNYKWRAAPSFQAIAETWVLSCRGPFVVGSLIRLKDPSNLTAKPGSIAYVYGYDGDFVKVLWSRDHLSGLQAHGCYYPDHFEQVTEFL